MLTITKIINYSAKLSERPKGSLKERREWAAQNGYCTMCVARRSTCGYNTCDVCRDRSRRYR